MWLISIKYKSLFITLNPQKICPNMLEIAKPYINEKETSLIWMSNFSGSLLLVINKSIVFILDAWNWRFIFQIRISKIDYCASTYFNCNDAAHCDVLIIEKKKPAHSHKILTTGTQETTRSRNDDWKRKPFSPNT